MSVAAVRRLRMVYVCIGPIVLQNLTIFSSLAARSAIRLFALVHRRTIASRGSLASAALTPGKQWALAGDGIVASQAAAGSAPLP